MGSRERWIVGLLLGGLFLILFYGQAGTIEVDRALGLVGGGITLAWLIRLTTAQIRYKSTQVVSNPVHASISGADDVEGIGRYAVIKLGGLNAMGLKARGKKGTIIAPKDAITEIGNNLAVNTRVTKIPEEALPHEIYENLDDLELSEPLYLGEAHEGDMNLEELNESEEMERMKDLNRVVNKQRDMLKDVMKDTEDLKGYKERIGKKKDQAESLISQVFKDED